MADRITKFLRKLSGKQRTAIEQVIAMIIADDIDGLNIKKIAGYDNFYRVRVGRVRVIFAKTNDGNAIYDIKWRDDQTYRDF